MMAFNMEFELQQLLSQMLTGIWISHISQMSLLFLIKVSNIYSVINWVYNLNILTVLKWYSIVVIL